MIRDRILKPLTWKMSEITFSPPGRKALLLGLGRYARQSLDWTRRLVVGVCRSTISLLLGAALAGLFGVGMAAGFGGAMVGSAPDDAVSRLFSNSHWVRKANDAYSQGRAARGARRMQSDTEAQLRAANTAERLFVFAASVVGFYGAYRSGNRLEKWWKGEGKFPLAPKGKSALEFAGFALVVFIIGLAGVGLIGSSVEALTGNDGSVLAVRGTRDPFPGRSGPVTVESLRSDALTGFCVGLALTGGGGVFVGWVFYRIIKGLRSLFRPAQSKEPGNE